jgi:hypothetical protein
MKVVVYQSPNRLGLISLNETIVAPRPTGSGDPGAECHPVKNGVRFGLRAALDRPSKNPREEHHAVFQGRI